MLSRWDIEERVTAVVARLAGVSACHIRPDLRLSHLGCDGDVVTDLIDVLEEEFEVSAGLAGEAPLDALWDVVRLFHRAVHGSAPANVIRVGGVVIRL